MRITSAQPAAARRIAWRLWRTFISDVDEPTPELLEGLAATRRAEGDVDLARGLETLLRSRLFHSDAYEFRRVLSPVEWTVSVLRAGETFPPHPDLVEVVASCEQMGQRLFRPPNVAGWPGGLEWLTEAGLVARQNFAAWLTSDESSIATDHWQRLAQRHGVTGVDAEIDFWAALFWGRQPDSQEREAWPRCQARTIPTAHAFGMRRAFQSRHVSRLKQEREYGNARYVDAQKFPQDRERHDGRLLGAGSRRARAMAQSRCRGRNGHDRTPPGRHRIARGQRWSEHRDPVCRRCVSSARPTLAIAEKDVIKLDDHLGLHPAMKSWHELWDNGRLSIVENCGYPHPNRSHFESMDIWHAGQVGSPATSGWLGRASDNAAAGDLCYVGTGTVPHALSCKQHVVASLAHMDDLRFRPDTAAAASIGQGDLAGTIAARLGQARDLRPACPPRASRWVRT